jgi:FlaA1/EpsC-like NDP-sugar epimerase
MKSDFKDLLKEYFLPKWIVLLYDLSVIGFVFMFTTYLIADFSYGKLQLLSTYHQIIASTLIYLLVYLLIKPHHNILRHTTLKDFSTIIFALVTGSVGLLGLSAIGRTFSAYSQYAIPYAVIIIHFFISIFILLASRLFIKAAYHSLFLKPESVQNTMIFGAGRLGMIAQNVLERKNQLSYNVVGFIDNNPNLHGKKINGVRVYSANECMVHHGFAGAFSNRWWLQCRTCL